jgi:hypothetical protein
MDANAGSLSMSPTVLLPWLALPLAISSGLWLNATPRCLSGMTYSIMTVTQTCVERMRGELAKEPVNE